MQNRLTAGVALVLSWLVFQSSAALAQCSLNIQSDIGSGWNKASVSYAVEKNSLKIKVGDVGKDDADSIYIGSIKGCSTLTIDVSNISGNYAWDGKIIGFSFFNDKLEPHQWGNQASFPAPRGRAIEDGFVKAGPAQSAKLVYDIANSAATTHIGAKVFIGRNNAVELRFSAQAARPDVQLSAPQPPRSPKRYAARASQRPDANSCSLSCHQPRGEHGAFAYTRDFSIPADAHCPDDGD